MDQMLGKLVRLRPPKPEDYPHYASWMNDLRTQANLMRGPMRATTDSVKNWIEGEYKKHNMARFSIETMDGVLIGHIFYQEGPVRLGATIGVVTGVEHWGKGYAQEAHELLLEFLFVERGLRCVSLWTQARNERGVHAANKMGFTVSARLRENAIIEGKPTDILVMDMTRKEYFESRKRADPLCQQDSQDK